VWGPSGVTRARLRRVPFVCAQPAGGAAAPTSVPHSHGVCSPRTPSTLVFTTPPLPSMTRGNGANDSRRRRTQRNRNGTRCPPSPPSPCENAYEHADMPPPPPPPPPRPCHTRRRVVIARPPAFVVRQRAGGPDHLSGRTPLSVAASDMETATTVTNNGGKCDTAAIGRTPVFTAALPALCVRIRAVVATTTAGDNRAPLGCPLASLPVRHGARHSPPTTVVEALGACRLVVAYLLNIRILGPVAPLTGQYSRGGLN